MVEDSGAGSGAGGGGAASQVKTFPDDPAAWAEEKTWDEWFAAQPKPVQAMLTRQGAEASDMQAIRTRFGEGFDVIDKAMRDESGEEVKRLARLRDPRFYDLALVKGAKTFDEVYGGIEGGGEGGGSVKRDANDPVIQRLDKLDARLTRDELEKAKSAHVELRNQEFIALSREVPDLFMYHDEKIDPEAKTKNEAAKKRAERIINIAEQRSKAQYGDNYFAIGKRVSLKDVLDDVMLFTDRVGEPPPAATRTSRAGAADARREPEPSSDPSVQREAMLKNIRAAGGFARSARAGRG